MSAATNILNGAVYGALLLLLSSGLVLLYGLRRVVNFAHGGIYALGAYFGFTVAGQLGFWAGLLFGALALAPLGWALDRYGLARLGGRDPLTTLIVTFGLLLVIEEAIQLLWGKETRALTLPAGLDGSVLLFGAAFPAYRLFVVALGLAVALGLQAWLRGTRHGLHIRAASEDPLTAGLQGVNADRLGATVVAVGCALAGLAGIAAAPLLSLSPTMGAAIVIDCFVVVVTGGLGSFGGAVVAALVLGQVQAWGAVHLPEVAALLPVALMAAVLVVRPAGLAGKRT